MPSSFLVPNCHRQLLAQITRSRTSYKLQHSCCTLGVPTLMFPFARGQVFVPWRLKGGPFKLRCRKSAKECCKTAGRLTAKFDPPWDGNGCRNCVVSGRPFRAKHGERERERELWQTCLVKESSQIYGAPCRSKTNSPWLTTCWPWEQGGVRVLTPVYDPTTMENGERQNWQF